MRQGNAVFAAALRQNRPHRWAPTARCRQIVVNVPNRRYPEPPSRGRDSARLKRRAPESENVVFQFRIRRLDLMAGHAMRAPDPDRQVHALHADQDILAGFDGGFDLLPRLRTTIPNNAHHQPPTKPSQDAGLRRIGSSDGEIIHRARRKVHRGVAPKSQASPARGAAPHNGVHARIGPAMAVHRRCGTPVTSSMRGPALDHPTRQPSRLFQATGVPGLQRTASCCAAPGTPASDSYRRLLRGRGLFSRTLRTSVFMRTSLRRRRSSSAEPSK
jgi:hypothetical protein